MQDDVNWKISLLLDDELGPDEAIGLLEQIHRDPELQAKWYGYQTIRQALRTGGGIQPHPEFLERVQSALAGEAVRMSSDASPSGRWVPGFGVGRFNRWAVPVALAAAVAMVAVIVGKRMLPDSSDPVPRLLRSAPQQMMAKSAGLGPVAREPGRQGSGYSRLEDYLLVHSEDSLYLAGPQHMLGYARIVSHGGH